MLTSLKVTVRICAQEFAFVTSNGWSREMISGEPRSGLKKKTTLRELTL
jgi:hypothetical protein